MKVILKEDTPTSIFIGDLTPAHYVCLTKDDTYFYVIISDYCKEKLYPDGIKYDVICLNTNTFIGYDSKSITGVCNTLIQYLGEERLDIQAFTDVIDYGIWLGELDFSKWKIKHKR